MTDLIFQNVLMLIKQVHQKDVILVTTGILRILVLCTGCHDLMKKALSFNDAALVYVKGSAC